MSPVPFSRRERLTSAVGPDGSGSNPGSACTQSPVKSGIASTPSLPPLAGPTLGGTACPNAGVATAAASVNTKERFRHCKSMLSSSCRYVPFDWVPLEAVRIKLHPFRVRLEGGDVACRCPPRPDRRRVHCNGAHRWVRQGDLAGSPLARPVFPQSRLAEKKPHSRARLYANRCILCAAERPNSGQGRRKTMLSHWSRTLTLSAAAVLVVSVHSSQAADFAGSVQGVVKSASGQALSGAYVKLTNPEKRLTFMLVTQGQGRYSMNNLPPGNYTVQGIGNGFQSKPTPVTLTAGKPATADVSLTDTQADVPNGWVRRPGRVAGNELDAELPPPTLPEGEGKAIVEAKCNQCHFLYRLTQMRWTHDNWEKKIAWMRERIHERPGAVDLTDQEQKAVVDYLAKNFSDTTPKPDPNGRLSRTPLTGDAAKYIAVDFQGPNPDAAWHDLTVDSQGVAWANQLNVYALAKFDPKTYEFTEIDPPRAR